MASYRSLRGSKGTLGLCRAVCLWARILLGLCRFACVPTTGTSNAFSGFEGAVWAPSTCLPPQLATPWAGILLSALSNRPYGSFSCRSCGFQEGAFSMASYRSLRGSKGTLGLCRAGWAGILLGLCRFACVPTTGASMLLAVSKACLGTSSAATIGHPLGWNPAFCAFAFRVLPFESVSSRPYGSFSCRFCGFQEGAFSMASYRSLRGSKGTLGLCGAVCLWRVGLESCWGSAVSHACPPPWNTVSMLHGIHGALWRS